MKKQTTRLVLAGALALLSVALPSCRKGCYRCERNVDFVVRCSDDYDTHKEFTDELKEYETDGYTCKKE